MDKETLIIILVGIGMFLILSAIYSGPYFWAATTDRRNKNALRLNKQTDNLKKLSGHQKRAVMLKAAIPLLNPELKDKKKLAKAAQNMFYQQESDWAISGGIASGIGGHLAGLSAAVNTQLKNAEVREYNRTIGPTMTDFFGGVMANAVNRLENSISNLEEEIKHISEVPVLHLTQQELFDKIEISDISYRKMNGKLLIEAIVSLKEEFIYKNVNMCIDGCLYVKIKKDNMIVDEIAMVLPLEGITIVPRKIMGVSMKTTGNIKSITAKFSGGGLWAMQKRDGIFTAKTIRTIYGSRQEGIVDAMARPLVDGNWTSAGVIGGYVWAYNEHTMKACAWDLAGREAAQIKKCVGPLDIENKCRELNKSKYKTAC